MKGAGAQNLPVRLKHRGLSLDENDLWVAATALATGATLVSRDSDFRRIDRLAVADL
jgi:predicted nucleic acid-binding protein